MLICVASDGTPLTPVIAARVMDFFTRKKSPEKVVSLAAEAFGQFRAETDEKAKEKVRSRAHATMYVHFPTNRVISWPTGGSTVHQAD